MCMYSHISVCVTLNPHEMKEFSFMLTHRALCFLASLASENMSDYNLVCEQNWKIAYVVHGEQASCHGLFTLNLDTLWSP